MVTAVFVLGTLNLCLGIALAVAVDRIALFPLSSMSKLLRGISLRQRRRGEPVSVQPSDEEVRPAEKPAQQHSGPDWAAILVDEQIVTSSRLEDLLWVTKLQTQRLRSRAIAFAPEPGADAVLDVAGLQAVVAEWKDMLSAWVPLATEYKEESLDIGAKFEECLLDQAFEVQSTFEALAGETEAAQKLLSLIDAANVLRDDVDELLVACKNESGLLGDLPDRFKSFGDRGTLTRLGIEELFAQWDQDDPERLRLVSLVLVDLDRFAKLNKKAGPGLGDVAIDGFAGILHDAVRRGRGFDRVGRVRGNRFLLFLGDTSAKNAAKGADRIRQTIEASSCRFGEQSMAMTASCAVIEMSKSETPEQLIRRLTDVVGEAKKAGRNQTFCDSGDGPAVIGLPQYEVCSKDLLLQSP